MRAGRPSGWLPALAVLLAVQPATAPAQQEAPKKDIVVRAPDGRTAQEARRFVRQVATAREGQLSRFAAPVCPLVVGLAPPSNAAIENRIRQVAAEASVKQGKPQCAANLLLVVAQDADAFVTATRRRLPGIFNDLPAAELSRALKSGPVHAWNSVEVQNEDGERISGATDEGVKILVVRRASRMFETTQQVVWRSVLVINAQALAGKTLTQLADYAAMRTLAGARPPERPGGPDTILTLFDDGPPPPAQMTDVDRGFLRGLYRTRPNGRAITETHTIVRSIVKQTQVPQ
ncbi:hypothetical protein [Sphingomonas aracearum]|uniref:DUF2927 domain-containing protein n=1 Tax=Sphingomonas aracearum TaxID=2283317 RepID=A0A369W0G3_9SPHN|nr:hypothetical protein [Sphingomonas aracearum]RDE06850.1 hypothetical protein DVW87_04005 [Sphingomonas aracearum]